MTIQTLEPIIRQQPFFQGMEERHIELITGCATNVRFAEGQFVAREGDAADHFYLVREGVVSVECRIPNRGVTTLQTVNEGEILGWSWLSPPHRWQFDVRTQEPTHALRFDGRCLRAKCEDDHDLAYELFRRFMIILSELLEAARIQLLDIYGNNVNRH
jgi:CRP/FNR family cyclic AMP-dependent transcriptional regulator